MWNFLAQGVVMAYANEEKPPAQRFWTDSWNGYPAARSRLMRQLNDNRVTNPIVLSGDIHAFVVSDLHLDPANPETPRVASELVATSITSQPTSKSILDRYHDYNPAVLLAEMAPRAAMCASMSPVPRCVPTWSRWIRSRNAPVPHECWLRLRPKPARAA